MKIEVFNEEPPTEKTVRLALRQGTGSVTLVAVDEHGKRLTNILDITSCGTLYRYCRINPNVGLVLSDGGIIKEEG